MPNATVLPPPPDGIPTEPTQVAELTLEVQDVREVLQEMMEDKGVEKASLKVERLCALLDPRQEALGTDQLVNGSAALRTRADEVFKGVIAEIADAQTQRSAPVPVPVLGVEPADPAPKKKLWRLEERRRHVSEWQSVVLVTVVAPSLRLPSRGGACWLGERHWSTWRSRASSTSMFSTFWGYGTGRAPTGYARRRARSRPRRKYRVWLLSLVVPWDRSHQLSRRANFFSARPPHW